jgi:hypothetical protein
MGLKRTDEFRQDAVRIALTSGLTRKQVADELEKIVAQKQNAAGNQSSSVVLPCPTGENASPARSAVQHLW